MNVFKLLLIFFILTTPAKSNSIYNIIKIPNLEIYELKSLNNLKYFYAEKPFRIGVQKNISCMNSNKETYEEKYKIISKNLNRYSKEFLKKINLKYIVMCENLIISGIKTAGIPDHKMKTLIIDVKFNSKFFERVIHHEVFHIINDGFKNIFDEKKWSSLNEIDFKYTSCSTCSDKTGLYVYKEYNGFFTEYSKSTASEDMAEVFSHIVFSKDIVTKKTSNDLILKKKVDFIKDKINIIDNNFNF